MATNQLIKNSFYTMKTNENIVFAYIKQKHINQSKLAEQMGMSNQNLSGRLKKKSRLLNPPQPTMPRALILLEMRLKQKLFQYS